MRKKALLVAMFCSAMIFSCMSGGNCDNKVMAAEVSETEVVSEDTADIEQLDMPVITINTEDNSAITSDEDYVTANMNVINDDGEYDMSDMSVSIRLRGNSSLYASKSSYKLKFQSKQNILGIGDGKAKTWGLIANYYDVSLMRNLTMYQIGDILDQMTYSPNCQSVEVYVNGEYDGVYLLTELANVSSSRIDIAEEIDQVEENGYLLEMSRYATENKFDADTETYEVKSDLSETASIKEEQINYISDYVETCILALKEGDQSLSAEYIDIDSLVDIYIANEIAKNVDTGWDSFYLYKDADGKLCFGPIWDFDLALGNTDCVKGFDCWEGFSAYTVLNVNANSNPWFCYALSCQWFRELVQERWNEVSSELQQVSDRVIKEAESNYNSYLRNFERWDLIGKQVYIEPSKISALTTYKEHYTYLSDWIRNRIEWLDQYYNTEDFINGILVDEDGEVFSTGSNMIALSSIMAYGADISYDMTDNTGMVITINDGGYFSWSTQALATGFILEEGAEYELSFDYSCTKDASTNVSVQQNHDNYAAYLSETLNFTGELQHFSATFTATGSDTNAAFAIGLGGTDFEGSVVTLDNMCLIKKTSTEESGITATLNVVDEWQGGAVCNVTVTNNSGQDITDGWTLDFDFNREIQNVWCATLQDSVDGHYTISSPAWDATLADGESITFGFTAGEGSEFNFTNVVIK